MEPSAMSQPVPDTSLSDKGGGKSTSLTGVAILLLLCSLVSFFLGRISVGTPVFQGETAITLPKVNESVTPSSASLPTVTPSLDLASDLEYAIGLVDAKSTQTVEISLNHQNFRLTLPQGFRAETQPEESDPTSGCISIRDGSKAESCDFVRISAKSVTYILWYKNRSEYLGGGGYIGTKSRTDSIKFNNQAAELTVVTRDDDGSIYHQLIETVGGEPFAFYAYRDFDFADTKYPQNNKQYFAIFSKVANQIKIEPLGTN